MTKQKQTKKTLHSDQAYNISKLGETDNDIPVLRFRAWIQIHTTCFHTTQYDA